MSFTGIKATSTRVGAQITSPDIATTALDADYIRTRLTTTHDHIETGTLRFHPFATCYFGGNGVQTQMSVASSVGAELILFSMLIYVPAGFVGLPLMAVLDCDTNREFRLVVRDSALAQLAAPNGDVRLRKYPSPAPWGMDGDHFVRGSFTVAAAGIYCLDFSTADVPEPVLDAYIYGAYVGPTLRAVNIEKQTPPAVSASAHTIRAWQVVDPAIVAVDGPIGQAAVMLNENMAHLIELATGLPVPGNATQTSGTVTPHNHDGTNGKALNYGVASIVFGVSSSTTLGFTVSATGNGSSAPTTSELTKASIALITVRTPVRTLATANPAYTTVGASKLRSAVLVCDDASKGANLAVVRILDNSGTTYTDHAAVATGRQIVLPGDTGGNACPSLTFTSGGYSTFTISLGDTGGTGAGPSCHAALLYFEE